MNRPARNGEFDFWKLVGAVCILLVHSYTVFGKEHVVARFSFLAVEFFFMVSGWLFAASIHKDSRPFSLDTIGSESWSFLLKKVKGFAPYYVFGFVLALIAKCLLTNFLVLFPKNITGVFFDLVLLKEAGIPYVDVEGISWYLSSMLIAMYLLYPAFRFRKTFFQTYMAPLLAIWLLGLLFLDSKSIAYGIAKPFGIVTANTVRAIAEISLGICAHWISEKLRKSSFAERHSHLLSFVGIFAGVAAFGGMTFMKTGRNIPFIIFLLFVLVSICGSQAASVNRLFKPSFCSYLGKLSMALFFTHTAIRQGLLCAAKYIPRLQALFAARDTGSIATTLTLYLFLSLGLAVFCIWFCDRLTPQKNVTPS